MVFITETDSKYYIADGEETKRQCVKSKNYVEKVMFLAAVARPRWDFKKKRMWDGKIGMWLIGQFKPAVRNSRNQPKGTLVFKDEKVNREKYLQIILDEVLPAIIEKCLAAMKANVIVIQQDNAKPHNSVTTDNE